MTRNRNIDPDVPRGKLKRIKNFLPPPEELVFPDESVKITISLSKTSVDFFKVKAKRCHTKYQQMIRTLVDAYVFQHSQ